MTGERVIEKGIFNGLTFLQNRSIIKDECKKAWIINMGMAFI